MERDEAVRLNRSNFGTVIVIGVAIGLATSVFAFVIAGGGHGLVSGMFSISSLVLAPAAFAGVLRRRQRAGRIAMLVTPVMGLGIDVLIWREGIGEQIFAKIWNAIPAAFAIWVVCWLSWQFVLLSASLRPPREDGA